MEKHCKHCGLTKPVEEFHKDRSTADGLNFYCKTCMRERKATFLKTRPQRHTAPEGMKYCPRCKETKLVEQFPHSERTFDGYYTRCKQCSFEVHRDWRLKNKEHAAQQQKQWRTENKERAADYFLKRYYGLAHGEYAKRLVSQNGLCAICQTAASSQKSRFHVDHDHDTGQVRGLLCSPCNLGIGQLRHDKTILLAAVRYLESVLPICS